MDFLHEKLHAYQAALRFGEHVYTVCQRKGGIRASLKDQLERATESIVLNIAEGNGKKSAAERRRFFESARASAFECAAIVDLLRIQSIITTDHASEMKLLLQRTASMLSGLMR
jgi:four helix bundle protein